jgi:hypothetical protein
MQTYEIREVWRSSKAHKDACLLPDKLTIQAQHVAFQ